MVPISELRSDTEINSAFMTMKTATRATTRMTRLKADFTAMTGVAPLPAPAIQSRTWTDAPTAARVFVKPARAAPGETPSLRAIVTISQAVGSATAAFGRPIPCEVIVARSMPEGTASSAGDPENNDSSSKTDAASFSGSRGLAASSV